MSRYVGRNSTEAKVTAVRAGAREVMFKPYAHRWLQPAIDDAPAFENSWAQVDPTPPYSVEPFAYRLNADGKFEVKGHLNAASATSGSVVTTVPDAIIVPVSVEPSYRLSEHLDRTIPVTVDGGTTYVPGTIVLDNTTGELKVYFTTGGAHVHTMIRRTDLTAQTVATGAFDQVTLGSGTTINQDSSRFGIGAGDSDVTETKLAGRYGFLGKVRWNVVFTGLTHLAIVASGPWGWAPSVSYEAPGDGDDMGNVVTIYLESDIPGGTSSFELQVRQQSGSAKDLAEAMFQITYLGAFTNPSTDYDVF